MTELLGDVRYSLRGLARNPGFALAAILTLALGIGATTAVYTIVDRVLLRPLPFANADRLVMVGHHNEHVGADEAYVSWETFSAMAAALPELDGTAGVSPTWDFAVRSPGEPTQVKGYWVSASFFQLLGVRPEIGRAFSADEDVAGGAAVAMVSHRLWQERFGSATDVRGKTMMLGGASTAVIGVVPPSFRFGENVDVWVPIAQNPLVTRGRQVRWVQELARLAPGVPLERGRAAVETYMNRLATEFPETNGGLRATVMGLHDVTVGGARGALWVLLAGVTFVLLIAVVNIGNLLLARATARRGELAVRAALGAGRGRIIRQLLSESVTLGVIGGSAGVLLSMWLLAAVRRLGPASLPRMQELHVDARVLLVAGAITLASGLAFGLMPALSLAREDLATGLREGGRGVMGRENRVLDGLVVVEVALAMVLLAGAGLMIRSFDALLRTNPGFEAGQVLTFQLGFPEGYEDPGRRLTFLDRMFGELKTLPGIEVAGGVTRLPLGGQLSTRVEIRDQPRSPSAQPELQFRRATGGFFEALRVPLVKGRYFTDADRPGGPGVAILNASFAARTWPGQDPIGKQLRFWYANMPPDAPWLEVVGIVADVRQASLDAAGPSSIYVPFYTLPPSSPMVVLRTHGDPVAVTNAVRARLRNLEPNALIWDVRPMTDLVDASVAGRRFNMLVLALFAVLAASLASVGIYGVMAYGVRRRTHEIGVRMALGAGRWEILKSVVLRGMRLALAGLACGLVAALLMTRWMRALLYEVSATDPMAFTGVALLLAAVALLACWLPARRAAATDPMEALRHE